MSALSRFKKIFSTPLGDNMSHTSLLENYHTLDLEILPEKVKKNGFVYILVERTTEKCIYQQTDDGEIYGYEVFKTCIRLFREHMIKLAVTRNQPINTAWKEYREQFPGDEEFGKRAWTYKNLDDAKKRYIGI